MVFNTTYNHLDTVIARKSHYIQTHVCYNGANGPMILNNYELHGMTLFIP